MSGARVFRSFARAAALKRQRDEIARARRRIEGIRARVAAGTLTDADHRLIVKMGPNLLAYIGYEPRVTL